MGFNVVVKPTHLCNLACTYCYNDDERRPVMSVDVMARVVDQVFAFVAERRGSTPVSFIWHGGEPAIAGLPFYEAVVDTQAAHHRGVPFENLLQTNGTLLDDRWVAFLREHHFLVSISVDGPSALHDAARVGKKGGGTHDRVMRAIDLARHGGLPFGVCVTVSRHNVDRLDEVYAWLVEHELPFNVIPLNRSGGAREHFDDLGIGPEEYAPGWIKMYDRWFDADPGYVYCQDFVVKTRAILGGSPADCIGAEQCGESNISVDPVGDVYGCASLSGHDETRLGNLVDETLTAVLDRPAGRAWTERPTDPQCARCRWQHVCHGGCQARAWKYFGTTGERDYYCPSLFRMYEHVAARLVERLGGSFDPAVIEPAALRPLSDHVTIPMRRRRHGPIVA